MLLTDKLMVAMFKTAFKILIFNYFLANFATNVNATDKHADILRGIHLKAYAYEYPPFMTAVKDSNGTITSRKGFCSDFMNAFAEHYDISLEFVQENASEVAKKGQYMVGIETIARKEVDLAANAVTQTSVLWRLMDFTTIALQERYVLLVPWPKEESRLTAVIRPFNLTIWSMIFISTLAFVVFLAVLPIFSRGEISIASAAHYFLNILGKGSMYVLAIFTQHGGNLEQIGITHRFPLRFMLCLWLLMNGVVMVNLYTSTLTSFLTVVKLEPIPNSLEELVSFSEQRNSHQDKCLITMQKGHQVFIKLINASYTPYRKIGDWIVQNPKYMTSVQKEIVENIVQHNCGHMGVPSSSSFRIGTDYKNSGKCRMTISKPLDFAYTPTYTFQLQKDSPYTPIVNDFLLRINSAGLLEYWKKKNSMNMDMCKLDKIKADGGKVKPIKLVELSSAFFVLGVGITLSTLVFLIERFVFSCGRIFSKRLLIIEV